MSGGKVGYIHIRGMDDVGRRAIRSFALLGQLRQGSDRHRRPLQRRRLHARPGAELPRRQGAHRLPPARRQRGNGHARVRPQVDQAFGRRSSITNRISDAEIFPAAYRTLGYGKVVGQATGGMVIGTMETELIDGSRFRLPRTGVFTAQRREHGEEGRYSRRRRAGDTRTTDQRNGLTAAESSGSSRRRRRGVEEIQGWDRIRSRTIDARNRRGAPGHRSATRRAQVEYAQRISATYIHRRVHADPSDDCEHGVVHGPALPISRPIKSVTGRIANVGPGCLH